MTRPWLNILFALLVSVISLGQVAAQGSTFRSTMYRGVSQSTFIEAANLSKEAYSQCRTMRPDGEGAQLHSAVDSVVSKCDRALALIDRAMQESDNPEECQERVGIVKMNLADLKSFAPSVMESQSGDFAARRMAMTLGAGETSVHLYHLSMITFDDKQEGEEDESPPDDQADDMAEDASRTELDEAALNLLKEAYQRDLDQMANGGKSDYLNDGEDSRADAANEKLTNIQEGMEDDFVRLLDALNPKDPLAEEEKGLSSDGEIIFDPEVGNELMYRIQIGYFKKNRSPDHFYGLHPVYAFTTEEGYAKFYTGQFRSYRKAVEVKNYIRSNFIPDAFVVPYMGGKRVSISDAIFKELDVLGE